MTVGGAGFSETVLVTLFSATGGNVGPLTPLPGGTSTSSTQFHFTLPAGVINGPSFVQAINPPFIPSSSTGADPDGAFTIALP